LDFHDGGEADRVAVDAGFETDAAAAAHQICLSRPMACRLARMASPQVEAQLREAIRDFSARVDRLATLLSESRTIIGLPPLPTVNPTTTT
jgi:hypothetical protein